MKSWGRRLCWVGFLAVSAHAFAPPSIRRPFAVATRANPSQLSFLKANGIDDDQQARSRLSKVLDRFDTLKSAGLLDSNSAPPRLMRGIGFKRIFFWLFVGFMWKWYRARFINKIPVWDRQPQWNMVVTNREQEKELKAYTCKTCGATLFIARNREWFFKGDTGLGGLGCFNCGAKGEDNFVMDRDRIVEDVGDDDDYFDYERPLDFVTAAERRALLKKAKGDEDAANQMLIDQAKEAETSSLPEGAIDAEIEAMKVEEATAANGDEQVETTDLTVEETKTQDEANETDTADDVETTEAEEDEATEAPETVAPSTESTVVDEAEDEATESPEAVASSSEPAVVEEPEDDATKLPETVASSTEPTVADESGDEATDLPEAVASSSKPTVVKVSDAPKKKAKEKRASTDEQAPKKLKKPEPQPSVDDFDLDALDMDG